MYLSKKVGPDDLLSPTRNFHLQARKTKKVESNLISVQVVTVATRPVLLPPPLHAIVQKFKNTSYF